MCDKSIFIIIIICTIFIVYFMFYPMNVNENFVTLTTTSYEYAGDNFQFAENPSKMNFYVDSYDPNTDTVTVPDPYIYNNRTLYNIV